MMFDTKETQLVHDIALTAMAEVYAAINAPHGTYTHLSVSPTGHPFWSHRPIARCAVLYASP